MVVYFGVWHHFQLFGNPCGKCERGSPILNASYSKLVLEHSKFHPLDTKEIASYSVLVFEEGNLCNKHCMGRRLDADSGLFDTVLLLQNAPA